MIVIQFFTVCGSILVKYPRVLSVSITHSHVLHVTFTLLYEMFKEWYFLLLVHVVLPVFVLGMHHFKLCDSHYANLCVSQTSLVLVYFALWLGDAKDDAKLKKCVSTRYATVLILLTVKCEYYYKKILMDFLCSFRKDCYASINFALFLSYMFGNLSPLPVSENVEMLSKLAQRLLAVTARGKS